MKEKRYEIILEKELPEVNTLVAGFPGPGLVGGIASEQMINTLDLHEVGHVHCNEFPPTAVIFDGVPRRPVRFFAGEGFLLVKSDMVISPELAPTLAESIIDWSVEKDVEEFIIFDGLPIEEGEIEERKIWAAVSSHHAEKHAERLNVDLIQRGAIHGISCSLLLYAHERDLAAVAMYAETPTQIPDPRGSAILLDHFSDYMEIDVDTESLIESAQELEEQYTKLVNNTKDAHRKIEGRTAHPPLYG